VNYDSIVNHYSMAVSYLCIIPDYWICMPQTDQTHHEYSMIPSHRHNSRQISYEQTATSSTFSKYNTTSALLWHCTSWLKQLPACQMSKSCCHCNV